MDEIALSFGDSVAVQQMRTSKTFRRGTHRLVAPTETLARVQPFYPDMGLTRIANVTASPSGGRSRPCLDLAILCLLLGKKDEGLGWLEQACEEHDNKLIYLNCYLRVHPRELGRYRREPRFVDVSKRVHLDTPAASGVNPLCPTP